MKKIIRLIITVCLMLTLLIPNVVFAAVGGEQTDWKDIYLSDEETKEILDLNPENQIITMASGLIREHKLSISKSGNSLIIVGRTSGANGVSKCGFTKITIQRRNNSSASWSNYKTYNDLYNNSAYYSLSKSLSVTSGYQYRVIGTHYAKKSIINTQKVNNTSNTLTF